MCLSFVYELATRWSFDAEKKLSAGATVWKVNGGRKMKARTQDRTKDQQICNLLRYHCAIRAFYLYDEFYLSFVL